MPAPNPLLDSIEPYAPGEQPQGGEFVKLNTNEFPYPAAPEVKEAIIKSADDAVRLYPSPRCDALRERLAQKHSVSADHILVGNGSDEILRLLIQAYAGPGRTAAIVDPSYSLYPTLIQMSGAAWSRYTLVGDEKIPEDLHAKPWDMMLLPVPNPPIGTVFPESDVLGLMESPEKLLVVDEAYADFAPEVDYAAKVGEFENLAVSRTFSKSYGLAGLRVGYVVAKPAIIEEVSKIADSYNVNRISQAVAIAALDAQAYYSEMAEKIVSDRKWLAGELEAKGFRVLPSAGNFVYACHADAKSLYEKLKAKKIFVRYFGKGGLPEGFRVTIGTHGELEKLIDALDGLI